MWSREGLREYVGGALWVWPSIASIVALVLGLAVSQISISPQSALAPLAFQGTADDARGLLTTISSTVVTVIALVLGLTVVALQLASTQFAAELSSRPVDPISDQRVHGHVRLQHCRPLHRRVV